MAKGLALAIGLNSIDPTKYHGDSGNLTACEFDAKAMAKIAESQGFKVTSLLTKEATRANVTENIRAAKEGLHPGDIFMLTYSGHGGDLPDMNDDEPDVQDETWCLYDGELVDDELHDLLAQFAEGVRILVISDSCHSGSVTKELDYSDKIDIANTNIDSDGVKYRFLPSNLAFSVYLDNQKFYDAILKNPAIKESEDKVKASVILLSGCQDNQLSADGIFNGRFTGHLLRVWKEGAFEGSYVDFHKAILARMPKDQSPNYFLVGKKDINFESQKPFKL